MTINFSKQLYNKEVLTKAAYHFVEKCYVSLDADDDYYYVSIERKDGVDEPALEKEYGNEVLIQATRYNVMKQTKNIREMVIGRALASTMLSNSDSGFIDDESFQAKDIMYDWFEKNDTK